MPLSEHEQRLLDEMERNLYSHDADFVATVSGSRGRINYTWLVIGALTAVVGFGVLIAGVATRLPIVGVLGFLVIFGGVLLALARPKAGAAADSAGDAASGAVPRKSFAERMNDRWERREDERGR